MSENPPQPADDLTRLRSLVRADLVGAMKARDRETTSALRALLAAIDNAEAVQPSGRTSAEASAHVSGAGAGVGSTEVERGRLSVEDAQGIGRKLVSDWNATADEHESHGRHSAADALRREANAVSKYLTM